MDDIFVENIFLKTEWSSYLCLVGKHNFVKYFAGESKKENGATEKINNLPMNIRLRSTILVNLRPSVGIQAMTSI